MDKVRRRSLLRDVLGACRLRLVTLCVLTVLQSVLTVGLALLMRALIDAVVAKEAWSFWAILLGADLGLQVAVQCFLNWYMGSTVDRLTAALRSRLLRSALYSADVRMQQFHSGALLSRGMEDVNAVCDGTVQALPALVGQITRLVAAFGAVMLISPPVALVLLAAALALGIMISFVRPVLKKRQRALREAEEQVMATMQEDLQQLELIQSLGTREQIRLRFQKQLDHSLGAKAARRKWTVGTQSVITAGTLLGTGALLLWGAGQVAAGVLSYGSLTAMLQLLSQFRGPVMNLSGLWTRFTAVEVAAERLSLLLETPEETADLSVEKPLAVVFENVTFTYDGDEQPVVENFSLTLHLEGWTSLGGISGRGKTTLFKLILGLYTPQSGRVYLKTKTGETPCSAATRHLFAYVPQDYALFSGTIRENLSLVAPDGDEKSRQAAMDLAGAEFVRELPLGEETHLGENNTGLSKGQLQRLAIARAILMDRQVLLLDECTSALDGETEAKVLGNLRKTCPNALLVTHRPQALENLNISQISI